MLKTYLYVPEELDKKINFTAKTQNKSKAEVIRLALQEGINAIEMKSSGGAEVLLQIYKLGKKYKVKGPRDASINHDYYLYGLPKKNQTLKP